MSETTGLGPSNEDLLRYLKEKTSSFIVEHSVRVVRNSYRIGAMYDANMDVLRIAAFLHDIEFPNGYRGHGDRGAKVAAGYVNGLAPGIVRNLPSDVAGQIAHCVAAHPVKHGATPATVEAMCLNDADRIDSIMSFVPQRYFAAMNALGEGEGGQRVWDGCFDRIKGWYDSMALDKSKEWFSAEFENMQELFPSLLEYQL